MRLNYRPLRGSSNCHGAGARCSDTGMFLLVDVRDTGLACFDFTCKLYRTEHVSVLDGGEFGRETGGFERACFAADEGLLGQAVVRIQRFVETLVR
jgi:aspartate/methionine/tyrosine aminotransferase